MAVFFVSTTIDGAKGKVWFPFDAGSEIETIEELFNRLRGDGVVLGSKLLIGKHPDGERYVRGIEKQILGKGIVGLVGEPHFDVLGGWSAHSPK